MKPSLTAGSRLSSKQFSITFLVLFYIALNVFRIGGDALISFLNDNLIVPFTLAVAVLAFLIWRQVLTQSKNRLLWWGLTLGWACWTIAELWWVVAANLETEVPYPSWADFFWLVGYVPMFVAFWGRIRSLPQNRTLLEKAGIWISILLSTSWTVLFILIPIVQNNDPNDTLTNVLNLLYPLVDLVLLLMVLRVLFAYQQGMYGDAWRWLSAGFVLHSFSNLIFSYAITFERYYPGGRADLLSTIGIDVPYNLSYVFWVIGLLMVRAIQTGHRAFPEVDADLKLVPNTHILISTKEDDTVIDVSRNYRQVFPTDEIRGKTISKTLGISPEDAGNLLNDIKANSILRERAMLANTRSGSQEALVSGIIIRNPQGEYAGVSLLVRMLSDRYGLDRLLTDYEKGLAYSLLCKTGTKEKEEEEIKLLLSRYYLLYLKSFYNRIYAEGGSIMTEAFLTELQSTAKRHGWQIGIQPDLLLNINGLPLSTTRQALPVLFETAREFVTKTIDESVANTIVQDIRSGITDNLLQGIHHFARAETNPV